MVVKVGVIYISLFLGRLDDIGIDGMILIKNLKKVFDNYGLKVEIILVSICYIGYLEEVVEVGVYIVIILGSFFLKFWFYFLIDKGIEGFLKDWEVFS